MRDSYYTRFLSSIGDFLRFEGWAGVVLGIVTVLRHASRMEHVEAALAALGLRLIVDAARAA